ncbi:hypothetical protein NPX13_g6511 [Xylaria arbuscula]|uniref:DUF7918 domain-containing protein n=1 Tax=Xylaria arbuscula TaxID=114810 RepID=A0A9W8TM32_9PEZI|nr:hypothetical protein NPX13_g6511 [Xylaria arbuscula]
MYLPPSCTRSFNLKCAATGWRQASGNILGLTLFLTPTPRLIVTPAYRRLFGADIRAAPLSVMAISESVPGIAVTVQCDKQPLPEFEDPDAHDHNDDAAAYPIETKYVECIDNAHFQICLVVDSSYDWSYRNHVLVAVISVDRQWVRGQIIKQRPEDNGYYKHRVNGKEVCNSLGTWSVRRFIFSAVKTSVCLSPNALSSLLTYLIVDEAKKERVEGDRKIANGLGTIHVDFFRATIRAPSTGHVTDANSGGFELAEKALKGKAISHGTSYGHCLPLLKNTDLNWTRYGAREAIPTPKFSKTDYLPEDNGPIVTFKFFYRSRDALKRELIIPRSPSRSPTIEDLTPAERDRLARERLNELREKRIKSDNSGSLIKREFNEVFDLTIDTPTPHPTKKSRLEDGKEIDVVDLTDD